MNFSCDYNTAETYPWSQVLLRVYLICPLIALGLIGNVLNILVFSHRSMRASSTNWFLLALAVSDTVLLLCSFCMLTFPVLAEKVDSFDGHVLAQYLPRWAYPISQTAQTISVYLVVAVSLHRFAGICHPFLAQRYCTPGLVRLAIGATVAFAVVFTLPRWIHLTIISCFSRSFGRASVRIWPGPFYHERWYAISYTMVAHTIVMFLLPFTALCVLDALLIRAVHNSQELRRTATRQKSRRVVMQSQEEDLLPSSSRLSTISRRLTRRKQKTRADNPSPRDSRTTIMLISIVTIFIFCNSLPFINNVLEVLRLAHGEMFVILVEVGNLLVQLNSSVYICIYSAFNRRFRLRLTNLIRRRNKEEDPPTRMNSSRIPSSIAMHTVS